MVWVGRYPKNGVCVFYPTSAPCFPPHCWWLRGFPLLQENAVWCQWDQESCVWKGGCCMRGLLYGLKSLPKNKNWRFKIKKNLTRWEFWIWFQDKLAVITQMFILVLHHYLPHFCWPSLLEGAEVADWVLLHNCLYLRDVFSDSQN